jgi:hypothetical protein
MTCVVAFLLRPGGNRGATALRSIMLVFAAVAALVQARPAHACVYQRYIQRIDPTTQGFPGCCANGWKDANSCAVNEQTQQYEWCASQMIIFKRSFSCATDAEVPGGGESYLVCPCDPDGLPQGLRLDRSRNLRVRRSSLQWNERTGSGDVRRHRPR